MHGHIEWTVFLHFFKDAIVQSGAYERLRVRTVKLNTILLAVHLHRYKSLDAVLKNCALSCQYTPEYAVM